MALCVAITAVWLVALCGAYEENQREKYDVHITPGAVTYGTHSTATAPAVMTAARHTGGVPMVSGNAVRNYARYGHASMPSATSSGKGLYATSSATVHTVGSGGGAGGGGIASSAGASSSRGIRYGGGSVSIPTLALATPMTYSRARTTTALAEETYYGIGPRRIPAGDGAYNGEWKQDGSGDWFMWDEGEWVEPSSGDKRIDGATTYEWQYKDGIWQWVKISGPVEPGETPLGATPWLLMLLLACAYALYKYYTQVYNKSK